MTTNEEELQPYCVECPNDVDPIPRDQLIWVRFWIETSDASSTFNQRTLNEAIEPIHRRHFSPQRHQRA